MNEKLLHDESQSYKNTLVTTRVRSQIIRYNEVVYAYNTYVTSDKKLQFLKHNKILEIINFIINRGWGIFILLLILLFLPGLNVFLLFLILAHMVFIFTLNRKNQQNCRNVPNVFIYWYFMPDLCKNFQKHFVHLNLNRKQIQDLTLNKLFDQQLNVKSTQPITIYDQYFYDSYLAFPQQLPKAIAALIIAIILTVFSSVSCLYFFEKI